MIMDDAKKSITGVDFRELKNKTILITGASGVIGTYFLAGLNYAPKVKIYAVCQSQPEKYWKEITKSLKATALKGDLCDDNFANSLPEADIIIHAAGYASPGKFMSTPLKTLRLNTAVTLKLLEKLKPGGKFLFMSSSEVYSGATPPYKESQIGTTNTEHPRSCYIEAKRCGEAIIYSARTNGTDAKSVRGSLVYGPGTRLDDRRVLHSFINRAMTEKKIDMMDNGSALRTYCYVTDTVQTMWNILLKGKDNIYNVGGISRTTIADLARLVGKILKVPVNMPKKIGKQALVGAPEDVSLNLDKIKKEFGKKDFISLEEGVKKTINWQKELYNS